MTETTKTIDILLLGSGGREHALAKKLAESPRCGTLYIAPGNGGTLQEGVNVALAEDDPRPRSLPVLPMPCARLVSRALGLAPRERRWRAPSAFRRSSWSAPAFPRQRTALLPTGGGARLCSRARCPARGEGRWPGSW